jgi:hypothetical protein
LISYVKWCLFSASLLRTSTTSIRLIMWSNILQHHWLPADSGTASWQKVDFPSKPTCWNESNGVE